MYICGAAAVKPDGTLGACGRVIMPMIAEDGTKDIELDLHSQPCARSVSKRAVGETILKSPLFCDVPHVIIQHD